MMVLSKHPLLFLAFVFLINCGYAQAPVISYTTPQNFATGVTITPVSPTNTGGTVPATIYRNVTTFAGQANVTGTQNGTGAAATFNYPTAAAADKNGNIYVVDNDNTVIRKITPAGVVTTYAGTGQNGANNGPAAQATFTNIGGIAVDGSGNVYVADKGNSLIRKITTAGIVSTLAGKNGVQGATNGQDTSATFSGLGGMICDKNGNIYVAEFGNSLIRKITPTGLVSTYAGVAGVMGSKNGTVTTATFNPQAVALDNSGNMYVADGGNCLVRKITPAGVVSTLAGSGVSGTTDGTGTNASFQTVDFIKVDAAGNVYTCDNQDIREITPAGVVTTLAGTADVRGTADGVGPKASFELINDLALDLDGNMYVPDAVAATIRKISLGGYTINKALPSGLIFNPATGVITGKPAVASAAADYIITAYNASGSSNTTINISVGGSLSFPAIASKVYGAADFSPAISTAGTITYTSSNHLVASVVAGKVHILSVGKSTITASDGSVTLSRLLTVVPATLTIIADNKSRSVNTANPALTVTYGGFVYSDNQASLTTAPKITTTATATSAAGEYPIFASGAIDSNYYISYISGTLAVLSGTTTVTAPQLKYVSPQAYSIGTQITPLAPANTGGAIPANAFARVTTIAGTAGVQGSVNGKGTAASFTLPYGIVLDKSGNLYVTDQSARLIRKIAPDGTVSTFAGSGNTGLVNGIGTAASFDAPSGITIDAAGNLYVADETEGVIRKITPQKSVSTFASGLKWPLGITIDKNGNFFVSETFNFTIKKITAAGVVSTFAGQAGVEGRDDGLGTAAMFKEPSALTTDAAGNIFVSDKGWIRKINAAGLVSTLAGSTLGTADGVGTKASFALPQGLAIDAAGTMYIDDQGNSLIRKMTPDRAVKTIIGVAGTTGSSDGIGKAAGINFPDGMIMDPSGNIYFCDAGNELIRKFTATGYTINKALPAGLTFDYTTGAISGTPTAASPSTFYTITGYNISGSSTAMVNISVNLSQNASLSALTLSAGSISPAFAATHTAYTASETNATSSVTLTPTTADAGATVTVNGVAVKSGKPSVAVALAVGANTINVVVTAQDKITTKTYTVTVTRHLSADATLSQLKISRGTLTPAFLASTDSYTASVVNGVTSFTVTPVTTNAGATVKVNGTAVTSGSPSGAIALSVGTNSITTKVTAADGVTTQTYTLTITRAAKTIAVPDEQLSVVSPVETPNLDDDVIIVHQAISPNGDGINDFLVIDGILAYPDNWLSIVNRSGQLIFEAKGYDNSNKVFDGRSNKTGQLQLPGTYFYQLEYTVKGVVKHRTGYLVLKY